MNSEHVPHIYDRKRINRNSGETTFTSTTATETEMVLYQRWNWVRIFDL